MAAPLRIVRGATLALDGVLAPGEVLVQGTTILEVGPPGLPVPSGCEVVEARGLLVAPGFIDLHCHGGAGADINDATDEAVAAVGALHRAHGVTAYTPTLSVDPVPVLEASFSAIRRAMAAQEPGQIEILGAHYESPYINPRFKGCQAPERLLPFDAAARDLIARNLDVIRRITLAPELPGVMEAIPDLVGRGLVVSAGHSECDGPTFRSAVDRGVSLVTHLYNAMSSVRKEGPFRVVGLLEAALSDDRVAAEVICDGIHVPPELLRVAFRTKGAERFLCCSDANRGAGMESGATIYTCGQEAIVEGGVAMLKDRSSLASSVSPLDAMVRVLVGEAGFGVAEALRAASYAPARAIKVADRKGRLAPGYDADLVFLTPPGPGASGLEVVATWCRGRGPLPAAPSS